MLEILGKDDLNVSHRFFGGVGGGGRGFYRPLERSQKSS